VQKYKTHGWRHVGQKLMLSLLCQWTRGKLTNKVCAVKISNVAQQKLIQMTAGTLEIIFLTSLLDFVKI